MEEQIDLDNISSDSESSDDSSTSSCESIKSISNELKRSLYREVQYNHYSLEIFSV